MKKLLITYETLEDGICGETCCEVEVSDEYAEILMEKPWPNTLEGKSMWGELEDLLWSIEWMKGRNYLLESVKDIREAPER